MLFIFFSAHCRVCTLAIHLFSASKASCARFLRCGFELGGGVSWPKASLVADARTALLSVVYNCTLMLLYCMFDKHYMFFLSSILDNDVKNCICSLNSVNDHHLDCNAWRKVQCYVWILDCPKNYFAWKFRRCRHYTLALQHPAIIFAPSSPRSAAFSSHIAPSSPRIAACSSYPTHRGRQLARKRKSIAMHSGGVRSKAPRNTPRDQNSGSDSDWHCPHTPRMYEQPHSVSDYDVQLLLSCVSDFHCACLQLSVIDLEWYTLRSTVFEWLKTQKKCTTLDIVCARAGKAEGQVWHNSWK